MAKLVAIYKQPANQDEFEAAYFNSHVPLIEKVPGLQKITVTRFPRTLVGDRVLMMAEMFFADSDALKTALRSPEMAAAGENLNTFAEGMYTLAIGEEEQASPNPPQGSVIPGQTQA